MPISSKHLNILIVEDNPGDYVLIEEYLREQITNMTVLHAKTFAGACEIINKERLEVILLDLTLPDSSGEELVTGMLRIAGNTPLIVLTGYDNKKFSVKTLGLGVSDYLLKDELKAAELFKSIAYSIERKRVTIELKSSEEKYRILFDSSPIPMWVYDPETLCFLDVNQAASGNYGYSREEFLSMTITDILPAKEIKQGEENVPQKTAPANENDDVFKHLTKTGALIYANVQSSSIDFSNRSAQLVVASNVTNKVIAENLLKHSEQRFKALVQDGSDFIAILDANANYKYVSPTSYSILGIMPTDFIARNAFDFIHEDDKARVLEQFNSLSSKKRVHIAPFRFLSADKGYRWVETIVTNMLDDSAIYGYVSNSRDVSERYVYEAKLRKQETLFRAIIEKGSDMKTLITPQGKIIFGTPSITRILGYTSEEYMGMNEREIVHPEDIENLFDKINSAIVGESPFGTLQLRIRNKQGVYHWCEKTITNLLDDPDVNAIVCDFWDITEKKKADLLIKESIDRYNLVSKATSDAIWDYTFYTNKTFIAGNGYLQLFGYNIVDQYAPDQFWEDRLHPEDKDVIIEKLRLFIDDLSQNQCSYEYRLLKIDGTYAYVNDRLFIIRENNLPVRLIGAINDITQRKEEELHLKLLESVIINASDAVMITEASLADKFGPNIIYVNDTFSKISGYSKVEIMGKSPYVLIGPKSDRKELNRLKNAFANQESCHLELINYSKKGLPYWVEIDIAPVLDHNGRPTHVIVIQRDITGRKLEEQEREKLIFQLMQNNKDLRQFSYITSHNLRGPIANLLGLTNLIDNYRVEDPTLSKILEGIKKAASRFDETIKDLTVVLNVKDRPSIPREELDVMAIHEKILIQCQELLSESKALISTDFSSAPRLYFNKAYLESILMNLMTNAIKYRNPARYLEIDISTVVRGNTVLLKFKDNGLGFDMELTREKMFGLYQRFHNHAEGKGMGLFLIKSQMESLDGGISVESKVDEGTCFTLTFNKMKSITDIDLQTKPRVYPSSGELTVNKSLPNDLISETHV